MSKTLKRAVIRHAAAIVAAMTMFTGIIPGMSLVRADGEGNQTIEDQNPQEQPPLEEDVTPTVTPEVTQEPTEEPTEVPTEEPTEVPTEIPTEEPTQEPTQTPTVEPTVNPRENVENFVIRLYDVTLNRAPDSTGLAYWVNDLINSKNTGVSTAYGFIFSDEFQNSEHTDEEYVEYMYEAFFGRASDATGKAYWLEKISEGYTREDLFAGFANSNEFYALCASYKIVAGTYIVGEDYLRIAQINLFAQRLYKTILGRNCDKTGMEYWTNQLADGSISGAQAAYGFVFSEEYRNKDKSDRDFIEDLYGAFMGRRSDSQGMQYWLERIASGHNDAAIFNGFSQSTEFNGICDNYGIVRGNSITSTINARITRDEQIASLTNSTGVYLALSTWGLDTTRTREVQESIISQCEYWLSQNTRYRYGAKSLYPGNPIDCSGLITTVIRRSLGTMCDINNPDAASADRRGNYTQADYTYRGQFTLGSMGAYRGLSYPVTQGTYTSYGHTVYVDQFGIASPIEMNTEQWAYYLFSSGVDRTQATVTEFINNPSLLETYSAGDIIIWYSGVTSLHIGFYDGNGGVYHSSSTNPNSGVDDNTGMQHTPLRCIRNWTPEGRGSQVIIFRVFPATVNVNADVTVTGIPEESGMVPVVLGNTSDTFVADSNRIRGTYNDARAIVEAFYVLSGKDKAEFAAEISEHAFDLVNNGAIGSEANVNYILTLCNELELSDSDVPQIGRIILRWDRPWTDGSTMTLEQGVRTLLGSADVGVIHSWNIPSGYYIGIYDADNGVVFESVRCGKLEYSSTGLTAEFSMAVLDSIVTADSVCTFDVSYTRGAEITIENENLSAVDGLSVSVKKH